MGYRFAQAVFVGVAVALSIASPSRSQDNPGLPLSMETAESLPVKDLAKILFAAVPEAVLSGRPEDIGLGMNVFGGTFLLKAQPAVESYVVRFSGLCSLRRVRVSLNAAGNEDRVEDIETDTVYAVVGPASIIKEPDLLSYVPGDIDPASDEIQKACAAFDRPNDIVEADSATSLMYGTVALSSLSASVVNESVKVECEDIDQKCPADISAQLSAARLKAVKACDDQELNEALKIPSDHVCVVIDLFVRGNFAEEEGWNMVVAGPSPELDATFSPSRVFIRPTYTIID